MGPSGPVLCVSFAGAASVVSADSLVVPRIAARGERRMCSGAGAEKQGPRFFSVKT